MTSIADLKALDQALTTQLLLADSGEVWSTLDSKDKEGFIQWANTKRDEKSDQILEWFLQYAPNEVLQQYYLADPVRGERQIEALARVPTGRIASLLNDIKRGLTPELLRRYYPELIKTLEELHAEIVATSNHTSNDANSLKVIAEAKQSLKDAAMGFVREFTSQGAKAKGGRQ